MKSKIFALATFAFAFALAGTASAISASEIYTSASGYLSTGSGMGAKVAQMPNVMAAQKALNACTNSALVVDGKMGPLTTGVFKSFQASKGIKVDGIIGPVTAGKLAECSGSTPSTPSTPSDLEGTDGTIDSIETLSQYSDEEVGEGEEDVKVAGFEVEASNDGDISIRSIKLTFDPTDNGSGDSDHLDDYIEGVKVWMGSKEVGSADVDDFSENDNDTVSKTISLSGAVVDADETEKFYITVDGQGNFDSGDIDTDAWSVGIENLRYEDGSGVITTIDGGDSSIDSGAGEIGWDAVGEGIEIDFVSFATAADTELKLREHSDNPEAGIVVASDAGTTDDVVLLKGEIELDGNSDVVIDEFPVTFGATTSNFNTIIESIKLVIDGEEYSESVPSIAAGATASITFNDLNFDLGAGDTVDFEIVAEIADTDDFTAGSTVTASVTATNRFAIDAENEEGDQLAAGEKSGTVGGEAQEFRANGISLALVSTSATKSSSDTDNGDTGTFEIKFKVTAIGDAVYVSSTVGTSGAANNIYSVDYAGTATTTDVSAVLINNTDTDLTSGGTYLISAGKSETFTLTVLRNGSDTDSLFRAALTSIKWDTDDDSTPDNTYSTNLDDFKTNYIALD